MNTHPTVLYAPAAWIFPDFIVISPVPLFTTPDDPEYVFSWLDVITIPSYITVPFPSVCIPTTCAYLPLWTRAIFPPFMFSAPVLYIPYFFPLSTVCVTFNNISSISTCPSLYIVFDVPLLVVIVPLFIVTCPVSLFFIAFSIPSNITPSIVKLSLFSNNTGDTPHIFPVSFSEYIVIFPLFNIFEPLK